MDTTLSQVEATKASQASLAPNATERMLAAGSIVLLCAICAAIVRGHEDWGRIPGVVWLHLATIGVALVTTPILMLRPRGDRLHRRLGWT